MAVITIVLSGCASKTCIIKPRTLVSRRKQNVIKPESIICNARMLILRCGHAIHSHADKVSITIWPHLAPSNARAKVEIVKNPPSDTEISPGCALKTIAMIFI
jgi:hypothetical protein